MRFYGIPSEEKVLEMIQNIKDGEWFFEDTNAMLKEKLSAEEVKERLKDILLQIKNWKSQMKFLPNNTVFVFVHEPSDPKVFKIYDTSSLGCSSSLSPPRWKIYRKEYEHQIT
ncbi:hypothetical protein [Hydrogenobacter hydrogenophilus]|uniref:Uncharacterized protein n=1 Tax=Hydrogenobacter hydrogenophilus TaxID=35835 RepID=A0A285NSX4_9AQUI|nr:hypothetical protein [Hydrogenobacter hydrogenophilus]SNZ12298.1 hypothetical protein SAMN06265353_0529 [Hydrogenobacter hydrogenophilus]